MTIIQRIVTPYTTFIRQWWVFPLMTSCFLFLGLFLHFYIILCAALASIILSYGYHIHLPQRVLQRYSRGALFFPPILALLLQAALFLFLERAMIKTLIIVFIGFVEAFLFFRLNLLQRNPESDARYFLKDAYSLFGLINTWLVLLIFFATSFYFGIQSVITVIVLLGFPVLSMWNTTLFEHSRAQRALITATYAIVMSEIAAVLLFLPLSYSTSAFLATLPFPLFFYTFSPQESGTVQTSRSRFLTVVFVACVLLLLLAVSPWH